jgi:transketolase
MRARVAVEAGVTAGWRSYVGEDGAVAGVDSFGKSAPYQHVYEHFGLTAENVAAMVESVVARVEAAA